jgi:hypothetical protein
MLTLIYTEPPKPDTPLPFKKNPHQIDFLSPTLIAQIATTIAKLPSNNKQDKLKPKSTPSTPKKSEPIPNNATNEEFSSEGDGGTPEEDEDDSENKKTPKGKKRSRKA